jgi:hypothetical protein
MGMGRMGENVMTVVVLFVLPALVFASELLPKSWWLARALDGLCNSCECDEKTEVAEPGHLDP